MLKIELVDPKNGAFTKLWWNIVHSYDSMSCPETDFSLSDANTYVSSVIEEYGGIAYETKSYDHNIMIYDTAMFNDDKDATAFLLRWG
jgi:hypothetical protein